MAQGANRYNEIGPPKTATSRRTVPLPPMLVQELRAWKLKCPKGPLALAFPNSRGNVDWHPNLLLFGLQPALMAAGVTKPVLVNGRPAFDDDSKPRVGPKIFRPARASPFFASWCANQGLSMKQVQHLMGHSNFSVTMDTYTKLFPDDTSIADKLAAAEAALMAPR